MANAAILEETEVTALNADDGIPVQQTSAATRAVRVPPGMLGAVEWVAYTADADKAMVAGEGYIVDMNDATTPWTAVRTFDLPTTAKVGQTCAIYIQDGDATHELAIRTGASGDLINGTDYSAADYTKLFITGELMVFECIIADTEWVVRQDGRIPCHGKMSVEVDTTGETAATWTDINFAGANEPFNVGSINDAANDRFNIRRDGTYRVDGQGRPASSVTDQMYWGIGWALATGNVIVEQNSREFPNTTDLYYNAINSIYSFSDGDTVYPKFRSEEGNKGYDTTVNDQLEWFSVKEELR